MKVFHFTVCFFLWAVPAFIPVKLAAQPFFIPHHAPTLPELEASFDQWATTINPDTTKSWKWYQRWQQHYLSRADARGNPVPTGTILSELIRFQRYKDQLTNPGSRSANWVPVGPMALPPSPNPNQQHGMGRINTMAFHPADTSTFWVGVAQGGIWKTTNSGQSWIPLNDGLPILRISDIAVDPNNPDIMYASVGDYAYLGIALHLDNRKRHTHYGLGVYKTTDGGQNWFPTSLGFNLNQSDASLIRRVFVNPANSNHLLAAGIEGIFKSLDGGNTWNTVLDSLIWDIEPSPQNPQVIYASSGFVGTLQQGHAGIMKSTDFGDTWTWLNTGIPAQGPAQRVELALSPSDSNYVYAVACNLNGGFYALYRSEDGGTNWNIRADAGTIPNILSHYTGNNTSSGQGTYDLAILVNPFNKEEVYIGGINIWGSVDGGISWNPVSYWTGAYGASIHADQHMFQYHHLDGKYYVCNDGGIFRTDSMIISAWDSAFAGIEWPTQWEDLSDGMNITSFYRIGIHPSFPDNMLAGAQDNSTFFKQGNSWSNIIGGDGMECLIHPFDENIIYGSYQYGGIVRSLDGGQNVQYDLVDAIRSAGGEQGAWTTPYQFHPDDPDSMYASFSNLWISDDGGDVWTKRSSFANMPGSGISAPTSAMKVAPSDPQTIYLTKRIYHSNNQPSEAWKTTNLGNNWTNITAGLPDSLFFTYLTVDDDNPLNVWVTIAGFEDSVKVFRTQDGGSSWDNISKNLPNLPANCIIHEPGSEFNNVYAGLDRGVWFTNDTMSQWKLYSQDLPNVIISELEIDTISRKIFAATFGRGVWVADLAQPDPTASLDQNQLDRMITTLFPNPGNGNFRLGLSGARIPKVFATVIDITGRQLYQQDLTLQNGAYQGDFELNLSAGLYFLQLRSGMASRVIRFVVN